MTRHVPLIASSWLRCGLTALLLSTACTNAQLAPSTAPPRTEEPVADHSGPASARAARTAPAPRAVEANLPPYEAQTAHQELAASLHRKLASVSGNVVHSPLSTELVLAMVLAGARGQSEEEISKRAFAGGSRERVSEAVERRLTLMRTGKGAVMLELARSAFASHDLALLPEYEEVLKQRFAAHIGRIALDEPARAKKHVDDWVRKATHDAIRSALPEDALARDPSALLLVDALYFRGDWAKKFPKQATRPEPFHLSSGSIEKVPTMHQKLDAFYADLAGSERHVAARVLELPYRGGELVMHLCCQARLIASRMLRQRSTRRG